ncbi:MAG: phosphoribosylamine--glycine ligase [Victivallaceae bacterium]|nr:phosphoribosylamine--glycine ligase [Victivallaceae bacterium]
MNVLVVGSGGREHALVWQLKKSPEVEQIWCAPGNAGIAADAECVAIKVDELEKLADFAETHNVDLTVVGPEAPLCDGIVNVFRTRKLPIFGPDRRAAQLEGSKDFAKQFMNKYHIPTARAAAFTAEAPAAEYIRNEFANGEKSVVVKADGLAAGKGVLVAPDEKSALDFLHECFAGAFGESGAKVLIEECLVGEEASIFALTDGKTIVPLVSSQDHKRVFDHDEGPNTGGMGAYSPAPVVTAAVWRDIENEVLKPFLEGVQSEDLDYRGVIFVGIMVCDGRPKVLEFNVRFGDPEIQPVMRRFDGDWFDVLLKTSEGKLAEADLVWSDDPAVSVVMASGGYPGKYTKGHVISGLREAAATGAVVFHAGTSFNQDGAVVNAGGRVLGVSARGKTIEEAIKGAYAAVAKISFDGGFCRSDIGAKALKHLKGDNI